MGVSTFDVSGYLNTMNIRLNAELEWLASETGYKTEDLEKLKTGDYNQKLIYHSLRNKKVDKYEEYIGDVGD